MFNLRRKKNTGEPNRNPNPKPNLTLKPTLVLNLGVKPLSDS